MHRIQRLILSVLLIAAVFSGTAVNAAARNLPAGVLIGDRDGISVGEDGSYFIDVEGIEAGDVITKTLTISNYEPYTFDLGMTAEPLEETGPLKLLDEVNLTITMGGRTLYDGRVRGVDDVNMVDNALDLGTYKSGDTQEMQLTLTVNPEMQKYHWRTSEATFKWIFTAAQETVEKPPNTGEMVTYAIWILLGAMLVMTMILLIVKKRRKDNEEVSETPLS